MYPLRAGGLRVAARCAARVLEGTPAAEDKRERNPVGVPPPGVPVGTLTWRGRLGAADLARLTWRG
eukprot:592061-Pyramimonas_sp.AAC.3